MFFPKGLSSYPYLTIMLYPVRTTFPLFAIPSVPLGSPFGTSVADGNKLAQLKPSLNPQSSCSQRCLRLEVSLSRLRIIHTRLIHSHLMGREVPPICDRRLACLSIFYILVECPDYSVPRNWFFPSLM